MFNSPALYNQYRPHPVEGISPITLPTSEVPIDSLSLSVLEAFFPSWIVLLCDQKYNRIRYVSNNSLYALGYPAEKLYKRFLYDLFQYTHPEDVEAVHRVCQKMEEWTKPLEKDRMHQYRYVINFRLQKPDNTYAHIHWEKIILPDTWGKHLYFILLQDISKEKPFTRVQLEIYQLKQGEYRRVNTYVPLTVELPLTQREMEVLQLIKKGLSSKEIAHRLYISLNTVRNHRSNLFKKTQAKNMVELLNYNPLTID